MKIIDIAKFTALVPMFFWGSAAFAQDLNPTVEVTKQYEGRLMEVHKPVMKMALPDSVDKFNLEFDYSVFDKPFRSSYEFSPAVLNFDLAPDAAKMPKIYLRAGAGYSLHPELDMVWTPVCKKGFTFSVYGSHRSFIGDYKALELTDVQGNNVAGASAETVTGPVTIKENGQKFFGYDMLSKAGISASYDWAKGRAYFDAGYYGTHLKDTLVTRSYDGVDIKAGVYSKGNYAEDIIYRADLAYRFAEDKLAGDAYMGEHDFGFDFTMGKAFKKNHAILMDVDLDMASYSGALESLAGNFALVPKYRFTGGRWNVEAGLRMAFLFSNNPADALAPSNASKGQIFYPDVHASFTLIKKYMDVYASVGGGPDINRYSSLLDRNHHLIPTYNPAAMPLLENTDERISAALGLKGNISFRFTYDLKVGYENYEGLPLPTVWFESAGDATLGVPLQGIYRGGLSYVSCQAFFTRAELNWKSQDVEAGGYFTFTESNAGKADPYAFAPAMFTGYVKAEYNWNRRIFVGVDCGFSSGRTGGITFYSATPAPERVTLRVPGYADLGMYIEVAVTRKFSFWLKGGNLLNMTVQKTPLYAESGIYGSAGICLNL